MQHIAMAFKKMLLSILPHLTFGCLCFFFCPSKTATCNNVPRRESITNGTAGIKNIAYYIEWETEEIRTLIKLTSEQATEK